MKTLRRAALALMSVGWLAGCAATGEPMTGTPVRDDELVRSVRFAELPAGHALRERADEQNAFWGDANVTNGAVAVVARKVAPELLSDPDRVAKAALADRVRDDGAKVVSAVATARPEESRAVVIDAARRIAVEGFVYEDARRNIAPIELAVEDIVGSIAPEDLLTVRAEGRVVVPSAGDDARTWRATVFLFASARTGELVVFYAREGWI